MARARVNKGRVEGLKGKRDYRIVVREATPFSVSRRPW